MRISDNQRLILGPPGTGKTTYVLNEIESLLAKGVAPDKIAFVSFTRKAIGEAVDRASDRFSLKQ
jgi:superfamily I DNA/RNA helicase